MTGRWIRPTAYLLGVLVSVLALPLLGHPAARRAWVGWQHGRAARLRGVPPAPPRRCLRWLPAHLAVGLPAGLFAAFCLGNALLVPLAAPLWWVFPADDPLRLLIEAPVTSWGSAATLSLAQLGALAALAYWVLPPLAGAHARLTLALLAPSPAERLADRVAVLTKTRADVLEAHGAELRRIERDLHDGTQARLVAIAMRLAVARQALPDGAPAVAELLREAHEGTEEAMTELRAVIRTIYPPILADQGLAGALRTVAARGGVPTTVDIGDLGPVPAAVETVAYFAVTEALANVAKHSRATRASVRAHRRGDRLHLTVTDNGVGGARAAGEEASSGGGDSGRGPGTGLAGIRRRAEALDGAITLASPAGGPTTLTVELPCAW
ncbi:sensor histidine kinase [Actinomycetes bacterium KLBMP 9797]